MSTPPKTHKLRHEIDQVRNMGWFAYSTCRKRYYNLDDEQGKKLAEELAHGDAEKVLARHREYYSNGGRSVNSERNSSANDWTSPSYKIKGLQD
jgi:hypothetical protein